MRGFPLVGSLIVLVVFAVSWPILSATIGGQVEATVVESGSESSGAGSADVIENELVGIRVVASAEMTRLRIDYLGEPITNGKPGQAGFEKPLVDFAFPREGIDFWIEAEFDKKSQTVEGATPIAVRLEVEDADGEVYRRTLWTDGEPSIADSVFISVSEEGSQ